MSSRTRDACVKKALRVELPMAECGAPLCSVTSPLMDQPFRRRLEKNRGSS